MQKVNAVDGSIQETALAQLGRALGTELAFDANQHCVLMLDKEMLISIKNDPSGWILCGMVDKVPATAATTIWRDMMGLNMELAMEQAGGLCHETASESVLYIDCLSMEQLCDRNIYNYLEKYVQRLENIVFRFGACNGHL